MRAAGLSILAAGSKKFFVQITDLHMEPFYNPENGHQHGNVCRIPEALNKSTCAPFRVEETADVYMIVYLFYVIFLGRICSMASMQCSTGGYQNKNIG